MLYLLLCVAMNVGIFLIFRACAHYKVPTFQAIVVNYVVSTFTGLIISSNENIIDLISVEAPWVWIGIVLGGVFISAFYLMALTTQQLGVTVSSIASKMSLVIPVLVSLFVLDLESRKLATLNYVGIVMAILAILLSSIKNNKNKIANYRLAVLLLPASVFVFGGLIDTTINFVNHKYLVPPTEGIFPMVIFFSAMSIGLTIVAFFRIKIRRKSIVFGAILGIINYFSMYFLVKTLSSFGNDGAIVYPALNIGIILMSALSSMVLFKEKLNLINKIGLFIAILSVLLIFYQESLEVLNRF